MEKHRWQRIKAIVAKALTMDTPEERDAWLSKTYKDDEALLNEVREQLEFIRESEKEDFLKGLGSDRQEFLDDLGKVWQQEPAYDNLTGREIGPFRITEQLGKGGMGAVYKGKRVDGSFHQTVAIKFIKRGIESEDTIRRFNMERQILASLNHPYIAQLYDGGVTHDGTPYLIMEYVDGKPIDDWCDKNRCSIKERLELFQKVCEAVLFAHNNMVIHRDLKPQNIFVSNSGQVKILDFGIAKILKPSHPDQAEFETRPGSKMWTPQFAAPEQITDSNIGIATDVYALGALLYILLGGSYPYNFTGKSAHEMESIIIKNDPPPPSRKAGNADQKILRNRNLKDSRQLRRILRGDPDAIILKAMRRRPELRYRSIGELLDDLDRYASDLPLRAREDTWRYRSSKFRRRHKAGLLTAVLFIGIIISYFVQITQERNRAQLEARKAQEVTDFLVGLFEANKPDIRQGETITANQLLETGEDEISRLNDQPAIQSEMLGVIGNLYSLLSKYDKADSLLRQSLAIRKELFDSSDPELASGYYSLAIITEKLGNYDSSKVLLRHAIALQNNIYGAHSTEIAQSLTDLSRIYEKDGALDSAYSSVQQAIFIYKQLGDTLGEGYGTSLYNLAAILIQQGNYEEAEQVQRSSLALSRDLYDPPHSNISKNMDNLGRILRRLGKYSEAESLFIQALEMDKKLYGPKHINIAISLNNLANLYYKQGTLSKADSMYSIVHQSLTAILGEHHISVATILGNWGNLKLKMQQYAEAEEIYRKALGIYIAQVGENHPDVATTYHGLGIVFLRQQQYEEAETYLLKTLQIRQTVYENEHHYYIGQVKKTLTKLMFKTGRSEEAREFMGASLTSYIKTFGKDHSKVKELAAFFSDLLAQHNTPLSGDSLIARYDGE